LAKRANKASFIAMPAVDAVSRALHELVPAVNAHATRARNAMTARITMLRGFFLAYGTLAGSLWASLALGDVPASPLRHAARAIEPMRFTAQDHWLRATGAITAALAGFQRVKSLHAAAARQLDSADYALTQLLNDLRPAMALPADVSGLRAILAEAERTAPERLRKALAA
jgi:hypothetical protein